MCTAPTALATRNTLWLPAPDWGHDDGEAAAMPTGSKGSRFFGQKQFVWGGSPEPKCARRIQLPLLYSKFSDTQNAEKGEEPAGHCSANIVLVFCWPQCVSAPHFLLEKPKGCAASSGSMQPANTKCFWLPRSTQHEFGCCAAFPHHFKLAEIYSPKTLSFCSRSNKIEIV